MRRAALVMAILLVAACSDGGSDGDGSATSPAPATTAAPAAAIAAVGEDQPGSVVVSAEADFGTGDDAMHGYRLRYRSTGVRGDLVEVTGVVLVPDGDPPDGGWPVVAWAHGTTGSADQCAPSASNDTTALALVAKPLLDAGYVVAATDYEGLGGPGRHPYLNGLSEARSVIDSVRAARALVPGVSADWVVTGHSQGGHAVLFTAEEAPAYAPELHLHGAAAFAPAAGLPFFPGLVGTFGEAFEVLLLAGYEETGADPSTFLSDAGEAAVAQTDERCIGELATLFARPGAADPLLPGAADAGTPLADYLQANNAVQRQTSVPILVLQGGADQVVPPTLTDDTVHRLCAIGDHVEYRRYADADHRTVVVAGGADATAWLEARFAGPPTASDC